MSPGASVGFEYLHVQNASEANATGMKHTNSLEFGPEKHQARTRFMQHLSRVKPEMMLKLISSNKQSEDKKVEIMELFPLTTGFGSNPRVTESNISLPSEIGLTNPKCVVAEVPEKLSTSQFTIFYNGVVNVYHIPADKVEDIMKLVSSNSSSNKRTCKITSGKIEEISGQQPSKSALNAVNENQPQKVAAGMEIVKKLSLQRFLQKRKERLNSVAPYSTVETATLLSKAGKDSDDQIILSLGCR
eukprot:PITA_11182